MGKRKSGVAIDEDSQSKSRKSRRIKSLDSDEEADESIVNTITPKKDSHKNETPKKSKSSKSSAITIDSDSDEGTPLKNNQRKKRKEVNDNDHNEEESKKQISLEKAFALQKKASTSPNKKGKKGSLPAQSNTLDKYFSKNTKPATNTVSSRQEVSANDFFGSFNSSKPEQKQFNSGCSSSVLVADTPEIKKSSSNKTSDHHPLSSPGVSKVSKASDKNYKTVPDKQVEASNNKMSSSKSVPLSKTDCSDIVIIDEESIPASNRGGKPESPLKQAWLSTVKTSPEKSNKPETHHISPQGSLKENNSPPAPTTPASSTKTPSINVTAATPQSKERRASYLAYKQREGPRELGAKQVPEGTPNCLAGLTILVTGVLEHIERDDIQRLVERCGGKFTKSLSKKTSYLIVGREPGQSKISKAEQLNTKILDEDGFFNLIKEKSSSRSSEKSDTKSGSSSSKTSRDDGKLKVERSPYFSDKPSTTTSLSEKRSQDSEKQKPVPPEPDLTAAPTVQSGRIFSRQKEDADSYLPWVEKYRPKTRKQLIGQQGAASSANKLYNWLEQWHTKFSRGDKDKAYNTGFNRFSDDGSSLRAALLSGPPGIGKTTTAQVVCQELGFTYVELNASDKRNKSALDQEIADALKSHSLLDLFSNDKSTSSKKSSSGRHHCILMDEVDGMAGNEDRGGMNQLIQLIKQTKIPIICMCNDRQSIKVRSLANYCFDLRFQRPRPEQIKAAMMSIACKESLKLPPGAVTDIIAASNSDVRQILNNMEVWSATELTESQTVKDAKNAKKDLKIGPFDVIRKVFSPDDKDTINDKSDLFFQDYSLGPLFVQENYLNVRPYAAQGNAQNTLYLISKAADAIADGDLVSKSIRSSSGNWSLLPVQAIYASVLPGEFMRGPLAGMPTFPNWLGKNSTQNKTARQLAQISTHMRLSTRGGCDAPALSQDYAQRMAEKLSLAMKQGDADNVVKCLDSYHLLKEDMDTIFELATWSSSKDWLNGVDSKTKAAVTRTYNKGSHLTPYAITTAGPTKRGKSTDQVDPFGEEEQNNDEEEEEGEDNPDADAMIVKKKPKKEAVSKSKPSTSSKDYSKPNTSKKSKSKK